MGREALNARGTDRPTTEVARALVAPVYIPWLGMSLSLGMTSVALPLYMTQEGLGYLALSLVLAAAGLGSAIGGVPIGDGVARLGARKMLLGGVVALCATTVLLAATDDFLILFSLQLIAGMGAVALRVSAQTWIVRTVEVGVRGRLLSTMGGLRRFGTFVGPVMAGLVIERFGFETAFVMAGILAGVGLIPLLVVAPVDPSHEHDRLPLRQVFSRHWKLLLIAASGPVMIMAARRGRAVVLPLIGDDLGLTPTAVGLLVAVGTGADLLLFPVAGYLMDHFGRLTAIVPAFSLMGVGLLLLAFADSGLLVMLAGAVIGVGNGLSAGTMMTLGTDLAPADSTSQFLAGFASLQDWGSVLGPLVVGWVASGVGLSASAGVLGIIIFLGVALIVRNVGETASGEPAPA